MVSTAFSLYSAVNKEIIAMKVMSKEEFEKQNVFGTGTENTAYAKYFIGNSYLNPLTASGRSIPC